MKDKKTVAVFFGGRSPEHDVSVVSGLQVLGAIDTSKYNPFPVYIAPNGPWFIGDALCEQDNYMFDLRKSHGLTEVQLDLSAKKGGVLKPVRNNFWGKNKEINFDIALPIFHGMIGENGAFQGLMELANVAYAGMRAKACAVFMDKDTTKKALSGLNVPLLPHVSIERPRQGLLVDEVALSQKLKSVGFPCCIKPANMGSSIGVGKANDIEEARAILSNLYKYDIKAIIEPFVPNLVEYNVAMRVPATGEIELSSIERPKSNKELLDFKEKYISDAGGKKGVKAGGGTMEGILALTREINPKLETKLENRVKDVAIKVFESFDASGAPRMDFISNSKSGEIWFNELNPIPGSYGYFLWEKASKPILFTDFITGLLEEAEFLYSRSQMPYDPVPQEAQLLKRHL